MRQHSDLVHLLGGMGHGFGGEAHQARQGEVFGYVRAFFATHLRGEDGNHAAGG